MRRVWDWYRERRWWTKAVLAVPVALVVVAGLFLLARAMQYRSASRIGAAEFVPEGAQVVIRSTDAKGHWERIKAGEIGRIVRSRMLRDPAARRAANDLLESLGLPTLNDLEDRRFIDRTGGMLTEEQILRFAGRDAMMAVRFGNTAADTRFCAATRLGFWDYSVAAFAPLVLRKVDVKGNGCLRVGDLTVAIVGAVAIVSNDADLMASALRRGGRNVPAAKPIEATIAFERSQVLLNARKTLQSFPVGAFWLFAGDALPARVDVTLDIDGADLVLDARMEGLEPGGPAPADAARYAPPLSEGDTSGAGAVLMNVRGDRLWEWLSRSAPESAAGMLQMVKQARFDQRVAPYLRGPTSVVLGRSVGSDQLTFASVALVLRSDDAAAAEQGLREMIREVTGDQKKLVDLKSQTVQGLPVWHLDWIADAFRYSDYARLCWTVHEGALIVANNLDFLMAVVTAAVTRGETLVSQPAYRQAAERLGTLGLRQVLAEGTVSTGFIHGQPLREGFEGFWPMMAKSVDNDASSDKLRAELEAEWRKAGRNPVGKEFWDEFRPAMDRKIAEAEEALRTRAKSLDYLRWAAFEVTAEADALRLRAVLELK